ncbi:hypothetical protein ONZ45_g523 [Pleurotus djamor]|nr:hypothetical protein ONZ45_g523 [Pleurotus djamor]
MPLCDAQITSFFKPVRASPQQTQRKAKRASHCDQDPAESNSKSRSTKKAKLSSSTRDASRASSSPTPTSRKPAAGSASASIAEVIDLTGSVVDDTKGARSATPPLLDDPLERGFASQMHDSAMTKRSFGSASALVSDHKDGDPCLASSSRIESRPRLPSPVKGRENQSPNLPRFRESEAPSSQTQHLDMFRNDDMFVPSSQTQFPESTVSRRPQLPPPSPFTTPRKARAWFAPPSPAVPSSQTQALCDFGTPKKFLRVNTQPHTESRQEIVPSSQSAEEKELSAYMDGAELFPRHNVIPVEAVLPSCKEGLPAFTCPEDQAEPPEPDPLPTEQCPPPSPTLIETVVESQTQESPPTEDLLHLPPAPRNLKPRLSHDSHPGDLADRSPAEYSPPATQASFPSIASDSQDLVSGSMAINNFFSIFDVLMEYAHAFVKYILTESIIDGVAIVTGAGSGIGMESSILFAQEGANVVLADVRLDAAEKVAKIIADKSPNVKAIAFKADVGKEADVKALVDKAVQEFGRLDVMFNNAGIMHPKDDDALTTEESIWDLTMQINLKGVWWGCKYAILAMRNNPVDEAKGLQVGGSIINTASFVAILGAATPQLAYTASKGGVLAMTRELAVVHAREGIRVNSICPGPLKTPLLMDFLDTPEKKERRLVHVPMGRFGEAVEIAKGALFLASSESSFVTGTDFAVDGGITAAYVTPLGEPVLPPPASLAS